MIQPAGADCAFSGKKFPASGRGGGGEIEGKASVAKYTGAHLRRARRARHIVDGAAVRLLVAAAGYRANRFWTLSDKKMLLTGGHKPLAVRI